MAFTRSISLHFSIVLVLLVVTIRASAGDQGPLPCGRFSTIPESLAKHGISLGSHTLIGGGYYKTRPSAATYLPDSDVIVEGTIGIGRSYLSEDQCEIYTDYEILGPIFHFPTYDSAEGSALRNALATAPVIVRIKGGSITINGLTFTSVHESLRSLQTDTRVLLLLKREGDKYRIAGNYFGAFAIEKELVPLTKDSVFDFEYRGMDSDAATQRLVRQRIALRSKR